MSYYRSIVLIRKKILNKQSGTAKRTSFTLHSSFSKRLSSYFFFFFFFFFIYIIFYSLSFYFFLFFFFLFFSYEKITVTIPFLATTTWTTHASCDRNDEKKKKLADSFPGYFFFSFLRNVCSRKKKNSSKREKEMPERERKERVNRREREREREREKGRNESEASRKASRDKIIPREVYSF